MYKYIVVCRCGNDNVYFPSNLRAATKHIVEKNAKYCWVFNGGGWLVSRAEVDAQSGKAANLPLNLDGEPRTQFVDMLNKFNILSKSNTTIDPIVSVFTSRAVLTLDELIAQASGSQQEPPRRSTTKQAALHER